MAELGAAGFDAESVSGLFCRKEPWNTAEKPRPYIEALPILLEHLKRSHPGRVRTPHSRQQGTAADGLGGFMPK